jgi:hypothetical protein
VKRQLTDRFIRSYRDAPTTVQEAFDKQSLLLLENIRHPSLRTKKYDKDPDLWQARVNESWRFYFKIVGDTYLIEDIIPKLDRSYARIFSATTPATSVSRKSRPLYR